ncbi:arabinofuranosidase catalytic domain-containing protein [Streptomyces sp. NPDC020917]|uniref:arabinofuranosidase catalytic domain-containing protein n=1 Tax=Streptomyces sp. NPDC020917 TaxID=3365102 RepID=UPI00378B5E7D
MFRPGTTRTFRRMITALAAILLALIGFSVTTASPATANPTAPARPQGPCDIYAKAGTPCSAAHSTTRALYASYDGPLYQVRRTSDGKVRDIGVTAPASQPVPDAGGYADAAAQDKFCAGTTCLISVVYDQSPNHNDLTQAPRGGFSGPAMGGANNLPIADMAPVTVGGHKAYGVSIEPGMGLRNNDTRGIAVDDQSEGMYWIINGQHYNNGCCFDYGNAETDSRDDGNGTMETAYFGDSTGWYHGAAPGPWIMTDQENNLVGCVNPGSSSKLCADLPSVTDRFVTAVAKGEPHHWATLGGDAQQGALTTMFDGQRVNSTYDPMRKQGAIVLGNGGDNSNGSQGTFYEGVMTSGYPSDATDQAVQANVVAARYGVQQLSLAPAAATDTPPGLQTFAPGTSQDSTLTFTNTGRSPALGVRLNLALPGGWDARAKGTHVFASVKPGQSVSTTFTITSGAGAFEGDLGGRATWTDQASAVAGSATTAEHVRNTDAIKINEFRTRTSADSTDQFIELANTGTTAVDISHWTLTEHPTQQAVSSTVTVPPGTTLPAGGHYVLGLSTSGLAVPARSGDTTVELRSTTGLNAGDRITLDTGFGAETRTIAGVGTAAAASTPLWQPLPDGPILTVPAGSTNVPVTSTSGFTVGQKVALGHGDQLDVATVTAVGKPGTQARLTADAAAGATNIKVSSTTNISAGDTIRLDIGSRIESVTVAAVGTSGATGTGVDLTAPLKSGHSSNLPFSDRGTGVTFTPATAFAHASNEPVQALGSGVTLDQPLQHRHAIDAPVRDAAATTAGYQGQDAPDQWFGGPALSASAGNMVLTDGKGHVADSLNYGSLVDPWTAEGYQGTSGSGQGGCRVPAPGAGSSAGRFPDGVDTDSNCSDFTTSNNPTPGAANKGFSLDPGPLVSLQMTTAGSTSNYVVHDDADDLVTTAPVTASSPAAVKQDATWVEAPGLDDPSCVSFESVNKPGSYLRHQNFQFHLQPNDGSTLFSQDATFCQTPGNSGTGVSFQSVNYPTKYIRSFNGTVYLASNGGSNAQDAPAGWADDSSWIAGTPWAQAPQS